jgi:hypothetical protein
MSETTKLKLVIKNGSPILVKNNITKEVLIFPAISKASLYINIDSSCIRKSIKKKGFYQNKFFFLTKNF